VQTTPLPHSATHTHTQYNTNSFLTQKINTKNAPETNRNSEGGGRRHCSVGIAARNGSIPGLGSQTAFYSMLTVRMLPGERVAGALSWPLTSVYCYAATPPTCSHDVGRSTVPNINRYSNSLMPDPRYFKPAHPSGHDCFVQAGSSQGNLISILYR